MAVALLRIVPILEPFLEIAAAADARRGKPGSRLEHLGPELRVDTRCLAASATCPKRASRMRMSIVEPAQIEVVVMKVVISSKNGA